MKTGFTLLIISLLLTIPGAIFSQGKVSVKEDPDVSKMIDQYVKRNKANTHVQGWRITVITTTDRRMMESTRAEFQKQFNLKTKWEDKEPYYHLKAGAYLSRNEANWALENVKKKFSGAFLSLDKIPYEEL